jgi:hypothetical protein
MAVRRPKRFRNLDQLEVRARRLSEEELIEAQDLYVSALNKFTGEYRRMRNLDLLNEMMLTAEAVYTMAKVLYDRRVGTPPDPVKPSRQVKGRY